MFQNHSHADTLTEQFTANWKRISIILVVIVGKESTQTHRERKVKSRRKNSKKTHKNTNESKLYKNKTDTFKIILILNNQISK